VSPPPVATAKLDAVGIEAVCDMLLNGVTMSGVARHVSVDFATLSRWLAADPQRSARVEESRRIAADVYENMAYEGVIAASDPFELAKAKEAAHHLRWRASKIAPARYGDKLQHSNNAGDGDQVVKNHITVNFRKPDVANSGG
jgi:transposase-like protein